MFSKLSTRLFYKYLIILLPVFSSVVYTGNVLKFGLIIVTVYLSTYFIKIYRLLDLYDFLLILFGFYMACITLIYHNLSFGIAITISLLSLLPIFVKHELNKSNTILKSIYVIYATLVLANFATMFTPGFDINNQLKYFLGGKNALAIALVPAMFFITYYSYVTYNELSKWNGILLLMVILSLLIGGSSTGIVVALLALLYILIFRKLYIPPVTYIGTIIVAQLLLISPALLSSLPYLTDIVNNYLGKSLAFSGRSSVWAISLEYISHSLIGYGRGNDLIGHIYNGTLSSESHSLMLELLITGGLLLLLVFIIIVFKSFNFNKIKHSNPLLRASYFYIFLYLVVGLQESVPFKIGLWLMLATIVSTKAIMRNMNSEMRNE